MDGTECRLLILATHAIQHFVPQYASLARIPGLSVRVVFASDKGIKPEYDPGFGRSIAWENLALDEFEWVAVTTPRGSRQNSKSAILREILQFDPDAVLVYGYRSEIARLGIRWARSKGRPLVYCADSERRHETHPAKEALTRPLKSLILRNVDWAMTVGDANEEFYQHCGVKAEKFIRTGFPIDTDRYEAKFRGRIETRRHVRERLGLGDSDFVMLNVGKLLPRKRQTDLLAATALLNGHGGRRYVAVLAGSGPDEGLIADQISESMAGTAISLGFVPHTELPDYYLAADLYVHTASFEPHSLAITEATYMGLPVVLSDRCGSWGPSDDVQPGLNGAVYPCGRASDLADLVFSLAQDDRRMGQMGEESRRIAVAGQKRAHRDAWLHLMQRLES